MKNTLLLLFCFFLIFTRTYAQDSSRVAYILDSVLIPEAFNGALNNFDPNTISDIVVLKNKDSLGLLGYPGYAGAVFIFTKNYRTRADSLKRIISTNRMIRQKGALYVKGSTTPYSGRFIDYYFDGTKEGEGTLKNGRLEGRRIRYNTDGSIALDEMFVNGLPDGLDMEYYPDGKLKEKGVFKAGKEDGLWENYFPNGQVEQHNLFVKGEASGEVLVYYSNGKLKSRAMFKDGKVSRDPATEKLYKAYGKGVEAGKAEDYKNAVKYYSECLKLDSGFADAWFARGTILLENLQFDEALKDFDKAIALEPYDMQYRGNRAFCRIRKYQLGGGRTLSKSNEVTVMASPDHVTIPEDEKAKICADLQEAVFLGDESAMIREAVKEYCK